MDRQRSRSVLLVGNPYSGRGRARAVADSIVRALAARGLTATVVWDPIERSALLAGLAAADPPPYRCLAVIGGDGTVNAVLNECRSVPLVIVPLGNENLLARWLGYTAEPAAIAQTIHGAPERTIDLGLVNDRYFATVASAGLDAWVVHRIAAWRHDASGRAHSPIRLSNYLSAIAAAACRYPYCPLELHADGQIHQGYHAMIFNAPAYAFGLCAARGAAVDDGLLDWVVFQRPGFPAAMRYSLQLWRGAAGRSVVTGRSVRVRLIAGSPVPAQVDGDAFGHTPMDVEVACGAARLLAPHRRLPGHGQHA